MNYGKKKEGVERLRLNSIFILHNSARKGFALVELLIAVTIFGIITTFVLLAYNRVSEQLSLTTLAYELALSFRQAQSYGVSVHQFGGSFDVGYGLHFDPGSNSTYALFADEKGVYGDSVLSGGYDFSYGDTGCLTPTECVNVFRLEKGNTIDKFCGVLSGDGGRDVPDEQKDEECNVSSTPPSNPPPTITFLDVTFLRPNPDAIITTNRTVSDGQQYKAARVYVVSPRGIKRVIEVVNTGQISLK
ncbi:MAG: type II secretion system protein [bacterium]|nr:type II secretion system protein [bacterium]